MHKVSQFSNHQLIESLKALVSKEQKCKHEIVLHLAEVDRRRLFADLGYSSLFDYVTRGLGYSNGSAYRRICAARAVKAVPEVYDRLSEGKVSFRILDVASTAIARPGGKELLEELCGSGSKEAEKIVAMRFPEERKRLADKIVPVVLKKVTPKLPLFSEQNTNYFRAEVITKEVAESKFRMTITVGAEFSKKLERVKALSSSVFGETGEVLEKLLDEFIKRHAPEDKIKRREVRAEKKTAKEPALVEAQRKETAEPSQGEPVNRRYPSAALRDRVLERDGFRCSFVSSDGTRCSCESNLQVDHIRPWAAGGRTEVSNLRTLCRTHNLMFARRVFGKEKIDRILEVRSDSRPKT